VSGDGENAGIQQTIYHAKNKNKGAKNPYPKIFDPRAGDTGTR